MRTSFWTKFFDFISPRFCGVCGRRLTVSEEALCASCLLHLPRTGFCAKPLDNPMARLFWGLAPIEKAAAWFYYEAKSEVSMLIYDMKYHNRPDIALTLGRLAAIEFSQHDFFEGIDCLVPMPLTRRRKWQRGYNQSHEIARGISQVTGLPIYNKVIVRRQFAGSQTHLGLWQRRDNVEHAFALHDREGLDGHHALVIDDIVTTGSTALACMNALREAGDVRLSVMSLGYSKS